MAEAVVTETGDVGPLVVRLGDAIERRVALDTLGEVPRGVGS